MTGSVQGLPTRPVEVPVTQAELARMMGISVTSVKRLTQAGMPSVSWGLRTRRYYPSTALAWARARGQGEAR